MNHDADVKDSLKPLDCITEPYPRYLGSPEKLQNLHETLDAIRLHRGVSLHVRQLFETAKNLSLYSWYVYRFHPIAQLFGYACLERALRERLARERGLDVENIRETLRPLMDLAVKQGWLKSESFQVARRVAQVQLRDEQTFRMIQSGLIGESPEIAEADILARASQLDYVLRIAESMPYVRNHIAHGGPVLHDGSAVTLRVISEAINQLFV